MAGQLVWRVFRAGAGHCPLMAATMAQWAATQRQSRASLGSLGSPPPLPLPLLFFACLPYLFNPLPTRCGVRPDPLQHRDHPQPQTPKSAAKPRVNIRAHVIVDLSHPDCLTPLQTLHAESPKRVHALPFFSAFGATVYAFVSRVFIFNLVCVV